jgi:hypothetical protein
VNLPGVDAFDPEGELGHHVLVISLGHSDLEVRPGSDLTPPPACPERANPVNGRLQPDVAAWAVFLDEHAANVGVEQLVDGLTIPRITPILQMLSTSPRDVVLVTTRQDDGKFGHTDTHHLAPVLAAVIRSEAGRLGITVVACWEFVMDGNPTDEELVRAGVGELLAGVARQSGGGRVEVIASGGTPALRMWLGVTARLLDHRGAMQLIGSWRVDHAGRPVVDGSAALVGEVSMWEVLRRLIDERDFVTLRRTLLDDPLILGSDNGRATRLAELGAALAELDIAGALSLARTIRLDDEFLSRLTALQRPADDQQVGAWLDLKPLVCFLLEVMAERREHDRPGLLAILYLIDSLLPSLAWQASFGRPLSPLDMQARASTHDDSRFGRRDATSCPADAVQAYREARATLLESPPKMRNWVLTHSESCFDSLAVCARREAEAAQTRTLGNCCPTPCAFWTWLPDNERPSLEARLRAAALFSASHVFKLRHHSPVGHSFAVPTIREIDEKLSDSVMYAATRVLERATPGPTLKKRLRMVVAVVESGGDAGGAPGAPDGVAALNHFLSALANADLEPSGILLEVADLLHDLMDV